jgi:hypothetical protein
LEKELIDLEKGLRLHLEQEPRPGGYTAKDTKAAPATGLSRGLEFEAIREFTRKAGVTCNNTPNTPTL